VIDESEPAILSKDDIVAPPIVVSDIEVEDDHAMDIFGILLEEIGNITGRPWGEYCTLLGRLLPLGKEMPSAVKRFDQNFGTT